MPREFSRNVRVASQLQRELAELLRSDVKDARLGMVTVSDVEVTRDLSLAKVYVSFLGARQTAAESVKLLAGLGPLLRHEVARRMRMRVIPEFRFIFDDSVERGLHMDAVIDGLHAPKSDPPET